MDNSHNSHKKIRWSRKQRARKDGERKITSKEDGEEQITRHVDTTEYRGKVPKPTSVKQLAQKYYENIKQDGEQAVTYNVTLLDALSDLLDAVVQVDDQMRSQQVTDGHVGAELHVLHGWRDTQSHFNHQSIMTDGGNNHFSLWLSCCKCKRKWRTL